MIRSMDATTKAYTETFIITTCIRTSTYTDTHILAIRIRRNGTHYL